MLSLIPSPTFNLSQRPLRHRVHRRVAVAAVVADVDAVAVAANRPLRKLSLPPPSKDRFRRLHSNQQN